MKFKRKKIEYSKKNGLDSGCSPLKQVLCFLKEILLLKRKKVWKEKKDNKKVKLSLYIWTLMHLRKDNIIT